MLLLTSLYVHDDGGFPCVVQPHDKEGHLPGEQQQQVSIPEKGSLGSSDHCWPPGKGPCSWQLHFSQERGRMVTQVLSELGQVQGQTLVPGRG